MHSTTTMKSTMPHFHYQQLWWLVLSIVVIALDRISKLWIVAHLDYGAPYPLFPHFNLTLAFNQGAAFSFLHEANGWQQILFVGFAIVICLILLLWLVRLPSQKILLPIALSLIIGGALGNVYDRVTLNYVIDFCDFYINHWHFAIFNLADSAITLGTGLLLLELWLSERRPT